jgi:hypothetical protein
MGILKSKHPRTLIEEKAEEQLTHTELWNAVMRRTVFPQRSSIGKLNNSKKMNCCRLNK